MPGLSSRWEQDWKQKQTYISPTCMALKSLVREAVIKQMITQIA